MEDDTCRHALAAAVENIEQNDTVILAFPVWWGQAPRIIETFPPCVQLSRAVSARSWTAAAYACHHVGVRAHGTAFGAALEYGASRCGKKIRRKTGKAAVVALHILLVLAIVFGAYQFAHRELWMELFRLWELAFLDYNETLPYFFLSYSVIRALWAAVS